MFTPDRIVFARARKQYQIALLFTRKSSDFRPISVTEQAVPHWSLKWIFKYWIGVESTIPSLVIYFSLHYSGLAMGAFSLTWPAAMPIYWKKESFAQMTVSVKKECWDLEILLPYVTWSQSCFSILLRAHNPNLQVVITHASHVCDQHSFGFPLRMNGMHRIQFDHARFDLLPLVIWSRVFWPSVTWNLRKAQGWSKAFGPSILSPALPKLWLLLVY